MAELTRDELVRRIASAVGLLDEGRVGDARRELARLLGTLRDGGLLEVGAPSRFGAAPVRETPGFEHDLEERELEYAFDAAETQVGDMLDADRIAQEAMRVADLDAPEDALPVEESPFATHTVADLLERQGHADEADRLRARLALRTDEDPDADTIAELGVPRSSHRAAVIATLERWLENLQRGVA